MGNGDEAVALESICMSTVKLIFGAFERAQPVPGFLVALSLQEV